MPKECAKCHEKIDWKAKRFIAFADDYLCESCGFEFDVLFQNTFGEMASANQARSLFRKFITEKPKFVFR